MKVCSSSTDAILATGQYLFYRLYDIVLTSGQTYHFTDGEVTLPNVTVYTPDGNLGPFTYQTGMTIVFDSLSLKSGTEASQLKFTMVPQADSPNAPILFDGYPVMAASRYGFMDDAVVRMSKCFLVPPSLNGGVLDTSPGAMGYFEGTIQDLQPNRFFVDVTVDNYLSLMGTQQMPAPLFSVGCFHQVYDGGCGLLRASFTVSGTISTVGDNAHFTTSLTQADGYFELGGITITSGAADGQTAHVSSFKHTSGAIALANPFSVTPAPGDTFTIYPGCDRQQNTCGTKFSNLTAFTGRFGGVPYMPVPQTIIDGGTDNPPLQTRGAQAGQIIGSQPAGKQVYGPYQT